MRTLALAATLLLAAPAAAIPRSPIGGTPMGGGTAHHVFAGLPSVGYEWWHGGAMEWGIGGELVYEDWSGEFSDTDVGFAVNVPMKFFLASRGQVDVAFRVAPGAMIGFIDLGGCRGGVPGCDDDDFVLIGARADLGVPISIRLSPMVSLVTGASFPVTFEHVSEVDVTGLIIPIYPRLGVDIEPTRALDVWFVFEIGPAIGWFTSDAGDDTDVEAGVRVWFGVDWL